MSEAMEALISLLDGAAVSIFGATLSASFCGYLRNSRKSVIFWCGLVLLLIPQGLVYLCWDVELYMFYPLLFHLPLAVLLYNSAEERKRQELQQIQNNLDLELSQAAQEIEAQQVRRWCENETANLILSSFAGRAEKDGVKIDVQGALPPTVAVLDGMCFPILKEGGAVLVRGYDGQAAPVILRGVVVRSSGLVCTVEHLEQIYYETRCKQVRYPVCPPGAVHVSDDRLLEQPQPCQVVRITPRRGAFLLAWLSVRHTFGAAHTRFFRCKGKLPHGGMASQFLLFQLLLSTAKDCKTASKISAIFPLSISQEGRIMWANTL